MGCIQSSIADGQPLLRSELPLQYHDQVFGPIYMSFELSRHIRNSCMGQTRSFARKFLRAYPQLTYEMGGKAMLFDKRVRSPNNVRLIFDDFEDKIVLVLNG